VVGCGASTAGGQGFAVGRPWLLSDRPPPDGEQLVAVVPAGMGYRAALEKLSAFAGTGRLVAVVLADDEAVLVANRLLGRIPLGGRIPVVDEIDAQAAALATLLAVEVAGAGAVLQTLTDPLRLVTALGLASAERADAARLALGLHDCGNAVVALNSSEVNSVSGVSGDLIISGDLAESGDWVEIPGVGRLAFAAAHPQLTAGPVGLADRYALDRAARRVDDLWTVDLSSVADTVLARRSGTGSRAVGLAALHADTPLSDPGPPLSERLGVPVLVGCEARAGWAGGASTPGAGGAGADRVVIDLGGGTIDVVSATDAVIAAGGGELLTACVAALTGTTSAAAEWVKRGPAHRLEAPQLLLGEDGARGFLDRAAPAEAIGSLVVQGPAGLLPFSRSLAPGEWRALRLRLKVEALGGNVVRALRTLDAGPRTVIVVGGPAGDEEVLSAIARVLPDGVAIGRGDVGGGRGGQAPGRLGHRYAVAYGLLTLLHDD
jgi:hypothetical protein